MMQGITQKLQGQAGVSALFPGGTDPARQRELFPTGSLLTPMPPKEMVRDATGQLLGFALHSAPHADAVRGYQGPTEVLVALDVDGNTVRQVALGRSYDNEPYVGYVREDRSYLKSFAGRSLASLADMDYAKEGIEGVSGATLTSFAVAESLKRTAQAAARPPGSLQGSWAPRREDWAILAVTVGGLLMAFSPLRGKKWARVAWQVILIAFLGLGLGALLSMHLLGGWAQHGVNWRGALGLVLLATVALLTPLATGRQVYCHQLCPHGALQLWMGRLTKRKWSPSPAWQTWLRWIGHSTLLLGLISLALSWNWPLASFEPFDAWVVLAANWVSIGLAVLGLVASIFIPQAYCHYGCPTGSLLSYLRTTGQSSWQVRDWLALLGMSLIWILTIFTN
jgi:MFS family permease